MPATRTRTEICAHGGAASSVVVVPGAVPERERAGPGLITVSWVLCDWRPGRAYGGVL